MVKLLNNKPKLIPAPMVIKNSPKRSPRYGSMLFSNSCLYSLLARTTPAKNAPRADGSPTSVISSAMPTTTKRAVLKKSSLRRACATKRKSGVTANLPKTMTPPTAIKVTTVACQPFKPSTSDTVFTVTW